MTNNVEIIIREETVRKLNLNANSVFLRYLKNATETFCTYLYRDAVPALFTLLYEDNKQPVNAVLMKLNFTLYAEVSFNPDKDCFFIEKESVIPMAEELLFQYMKAHPTFLKLHEYPQCEEEFEALKSVMVDHPLLLHRVVNSVWHSHENTELVQNCVHLLLSEKYSLQAKGLEKLGHKHNYQRLLIPYAKEIAIFLKALNKAYKDEQQKIALEDEKKQKESAEASHHNPLVTAAIEELNSAFSPLAAIWDKVPAEAEPATPEDPVTIEAHVTAEEQATDTVSEKEKDTVSELLINSYPVSPELFWILSHKSELLKVLNAHDNLEKASEILANAEKEFKVAVGNFSPDDMTTLHSLTAAGKVFEDAKKNHKSAGDIFVTACNDFQNVVKKT